MKKRSQNRIFYVSIYINIETEEFYEESDKNCNADRKF